MLHTQIILATRNNDKILEIREALKELAIDILTMDQFPEIPVVREDGRTIAENALKKAKVVYEATHLLSLADDTGLEVDYLGGRPGVYSSRFAGEAATYDENCNKLLQLMNGVPQKQRTARFRCVIAIIGSDVETLVEGICEGFITDEKRGLHGFGYDPVFYVPEYDQTFAQMPLALKNEISHRGRALKGARKILRQMIEG